MSDTVNQIQQLQDVELMNAISNLKGNPAKLHDFISNQKADLYKRVAQEHSDTFQKVHGDMIRASNTNNNVMYYAVRNKDLDNLQQSVLSKATGEADAATYNSQTAKRQFEINEWTVGNKQDTLFFLQITLIVFTFTAVLLYFQKTGALPISVFYGISGLLSVAVILTLIVRAQYTNKTRDNRFWNRRRFERMGGPPTIPSCPALESLGTNLAENAQKLETQLQERGGQFLDRFQKAAGELSGAT